MNTDLLSERIERQMMGVVEVPTRVSDIKFEKLKEEWKKTYIGSCSFAPILLEGRNVPKVIQTEKHFMLDFHRIFPDYPLSHKWRKFFKKG